MFKKCFASFWLLILRVWSRATSAASDWLEPVARLSMDRRATLNSDNVSNNKLYAK